MTAFGGDGYHVDALSAVVHGRNGESASDWTWGGYF